MRTPYELEARFVSDELAPQQAGLYQTQLRAASELMLRGAGTTIGVGSVASQYYLHMPGRTPEYVSSIVWPSPTEEATAHFAVLQPQDFSHTYFGIATPASNTGDRMWVEGVDLHPTSSRYGKVLVSYDSLTDPGVRIPLAIGAFVGNMQPSYNTAPKEEDPLGSISLDPTTHRRLGTALLSFWNTLELPPQVAGEGTGSRAAFNLARQVIEHGVSQANTDGQLQCRYDSLIELTDPHGIASGFVGKDSHTHSLTAVVRNPLVYPQRIDYIQVPLSPAHGDAVVSHYAITPYSVGVRFCIVPEQKIANNDASSLVAAIQANKRPLEPLDTDGISDTIRQLHDELGGFITVLHTPVGEQPV